MYILAECFYTVLNMNLNNGSENTFTAYQRHIANPSTMYFCSYHTQTDVRLGDVTI